MSTDTSSYVGRPTHRTQRDASWSRAYGTFCYNCSKVLIFSMAMKGEKGVSFRTTYLPGENVGRNTSFGIDPGMGVPVAAYGDGEAIDIDLKEAFQGRLMRNSDHFIVAGVCPCGYKLQLGEFAHLVVPVIGESAGGVQFLPFRETGSLPRARKLKTTKVSSAATRANLAAAWAAAQGANFAVVDPTPPDYSTEAFLDARGVPRLQDAVEKLALLTEALLEDLAEAGVTLSRVNEMKKGREEEEEEEAELEWKEGRCVVVETTENVVCCAELTVVEEQALSNFLCSECMDSTVTFKNSAVLKMKRPGRVKEEDLENFLKHYDEAAGLAAIAAEEEAQAEATPAPPSKKHKR